MKKEALIKCEERGYEVPPEEILVATFGKDVRRSLVCNRLLKEVRIDKLRHGQKCKPSEQVGGLDFYEFKGYYKNGKIKKGKFLFSLTIDETPTVFPHTTARFMKTQTSYK